MSSPPIEKFSKVRSIDFTYSKFRNGRNIENSYLSVASDADVIAAYVKILKSLLDIKGTVHKDCGADFWEIQPSSMVCSHSEASNLYFSSKSRSSPCNHSRCKYINANFWVQRRKRKNDHMCMYIYMYIHIYTYM